MSKNVKDIVWIIKNPGRDELSGFELIRCKLLLLFYFSSFILP